MKKLICLLLVVGCQSEISVDVKPQKAPTIKAEEVPVGWNICPRRSSNMTHYQITKLYKENSPDGKLAYFTGIVRDVRDDIFTNSPVVILVPEDKDGTGVLSVDLVLGKLSEDTKEVGLLKKGSLVSMTGVISGECYYSIGETSVDLNVSNWLKLK